MATGSASHRSRWRISVQAAVAVPLLLAIGYYIGSPAFHHWLWSEQGPLEISHVLIPLSAMGLGLATIRSKKRIDAIRSARLGWFAAAICGLALLCGAIAGEEASWGQHFLGWSTPETWSELNDQQETNLHNIGSWADQKPRAIVELGVILFGIVWPLMDRFSRTRVPQSWRLILPPPNVLPIALFAEGARLLEDGPKWLGLPRWSAFPRPSELQEFYFYTFFLLCMIAWRARLHERLATLDQQPAVSVEDDGDSQTLRRAA